MSDDLLVLRVPWREFVDRRRDGMIHALEGGVWFHRHLWRGERMAHVISADREVLLRVGEFLGLHPRWLQYKPLRDPRTGVRVEAWHWDLRGVYLVRAVALATNGRDRPDQGASECV